MIRLHHCKGTRSDRTLWLLYEIGVAFDLVVHPFDKSLRAPDYAAVNPAGRVAALDTLNSFLHLRGEYYSRAMSSPVSAPDACSRLSWHLAYGSVSMREVTQAAQAH